MDKYFLAANSKDGFYNQFNELTTYDEVDRFYIIKGVAGCGKSTFMKRLATYLSDNGYDAEMIFCSSDTGSLDGVISKKAKLAICDGTAPHVTEPIYPGAFETYLNFASFLNEDLLRFNKDEIKHLIDTISENYKTAYNFLSVAGILSSEIFDRVINTDLIDTIKKRADGIISRELKSLDTEGKSYNRLISGISPQGYYNFVDTLEDKSKKIYTLQDDYGLAHFMLSKIADTAISRGYTVYKFLSPLNPAKIEHIYIEELALSFITCNDYVSTDVKAYRNIILNNYVLDIDKKELKSIAKQVEVNIENATSTMKICKSLHDDLEDLYIEAMDFKGLDTFFDTIISNIK